MDAALSKALLEHAELLLRIRLLLLVVEPGGQLDALDVLVLKTQLAEPHEVLDLMLSADMGVLDNDRFHTVQVLPHDGFVSVSGFAVKDGVVVLFRFHRLRLGGLFFFGLFR